MQFSRSFVALALVSLCAASAVPDNSTVSALAKRSVYCQTSGGSPTTGDAIAAAQYIQHLDPATTCCQNNLGGSLCTTMWCVGTACVGICSNGAFSFPGCDTCLDAGNGLLDIANSCSSGGLSGGYADAPYDLRLILFHS
ncbi:hypothetical protein B0H11DRAFT_2277185 [Mycena galericulata]|nr:hypothetical protein B0H11DRAFT_2277185 [Mycena galericulata]